MGEERESAKPWVFIQCDNKVASKIKRFYKKKEVKLQYQPDDPTLPKLEVFVHPHPPSLKAMFIEEDVWGYDNALNIPDLHGFKIKANANDGRDCVATAGGFLKVQTLDGYRLYGLTVGHIFNTLLNGMDKDLGSEYGSECLWDEDLSDDGDENSEILELDLDYLYLDPDLVADTALSQRESGQEPPISSTVDSRPQ